MTLLLGACSGTEPTEPAAPAFPGTILVQQSAGLEQALLAFTANGSNRQVALDLSLFYPGSPPEFFQQVIGDNFDVSPDGRFLYVGTVGTGLLRFNLPDGGQWRSLLGQEYNTASVRVSPGGQMVAFHQPQNGYATWIVANDGGRPQQVLPPGDRGGEIYSRPIWAGPTRLLVTNSYVENGQRTRKVLQLDAPDWTPREITPLRNAVRSDLSGHLLASRDGARLFIKHRTTDGTYTLREYSADGQFRGEPIRFEGDVGSLLLSPDARFVAATRGDDIQVYSLDSGRQVGPPLAVDQSPRFMVPVAWTLAEYR
jgi:hypothetical protein